jgi:hypothetical protein
MRGGELLTPWGLGTWGVERGSQETADDEAVFADFANSQHTLRVKDRQCLRLQSVRKLDGEKVGVDFENVVEAGENCASDLETLLAS